MLRGMWTLNIMNIWVLGPLGNYNLRGSTLGIYPLGNCHMWLRASALNLKPNSGGECNDIYRHLTSKTPPHQKTTALEAQLPIQWVSGFRV